jgi:predicted MFS family arabinose efflux permease
MEKKKLATILGYLGLIPFFTFTIIFFISNFNNYVVDVYLFYANIILAFLCGSHWSKILNSNISNNRNLLLTLSVFIPVFSFVLDFFSNQDIKIAIYIILFFATNFIDGKIFSETSNVW